MRSNKIISGSLAACMHAASDFDFDSDFQLHLTPDDNILVMQPTPGLYQPALIIETDHTAANNYLFNSTISATRFALTKWSINRDTLPANWPVPQPPQEVSTSQQLPS
jgi:hypothetical protein